MVTWSNCIQSETVDTGQLASLMQLSAYIDPDEEPLPVQAFPEPYIDKVTKQQPQNKKNNSQHLLCQTK